MILNHKYDIVPFTRGIGLDLSSGMSAKMMRHWFSKAETNIFDDDLGFVAEHSLDFIYCAAVIGGETEENAKRLMKYWWGKIKMGGSLTLCWNAEEKPHEVIEGYADKVLKHYDLAVRGTYSEDDVTIYSQTFVKLPHGKTQSWAKERPSKTVVVIRYGAIGDCIVASSVLKGLKDQGYYVIFNTQDTGLNVLKGNPYIDEFLLKDKDQIEQEELPHYWTYLQEKYGRIINFSGTMEGEICVVPGRADYTWPNEIRRKFRAHNYYEFAHTLAGVPLPPVAGFYPTDTEAKLAEKRIRDIGKDKFILLWVLNGSSVHKRVHSMDYVLGIPGRPGLLQKYPEMHVILVGDDKSKVLEAGWQGHPQVTCTSGKWSLREVLSILPHVDLTVGPETGVVNVAGIQGFPTLVYLSHTSEDTLCRYWPNYTALAPTDCDCHPCYKLHYGEKYCNMVEVGKDLKGPVYASKCVANVSVEAAQAAIERYIVEAKEKAA